MKFHSLKSGKNVVKCLVRKKLTVHIDGLFLELTMHYVRMWPRREEERFDLQERIFQREQSLVL